MESVCHLTEYKRNHDVKMHAYVGNGSSAANHDDNDLSLKQFKRVTEYIEQQSLWGEGGGLSIDRKRKM